MKNGILKLLGVVVLVGIFVVFLTPKTPLLAGEGSRLMIPALGSVVCEQINLVARETPAHTEASSSVFIVDDQYDNVQYEGLIAPAGKRLQCPGTYYLDYFPRMLNGERIILEYNEGGNWVEHKRYDWWIGNLFGDPVQSMAGQFSMMHSTTTMWRLRVQCGYSVNAIPAEELTTWIDAGNAKDFKIHWTAQEKRWKVYNHAGVGIFNSQDTGCMIADFDFLTKVKDSPKDSNSWNIINSAKTILESQNIILPGQTGKDGDISKATGIRFAKIGTSWHYISEWRTAPILYNTRTYKGQSVYCFNANNQPQLYSVAPISSGGEVYYLPNKPVPGAECCNNADCILTDRKCELDDPAKMFTCVEKPACSTDIECHAQCQVQFTYRTTTQDYLYQTGSGTCSGGQCVCQTEIVKCSPNSCQQGKVCNLVKGTNQYGECIGSQPCPPGYWCDDLPGCVYQPQSCSGSLNKCYTEKSTCIGKCLATCPTKDVCISNSDCEDGNPRTINECVKPLIGNAYCKFTVIGGCLSDSECDDGNPLTLNRCVAGWISSEKTCVTYATECREHKDCGKFSYCQIDHRGVGKCIGRGCSLDSDCPDGQACYKDNKGVGTCQNIKTCAEQFSIITEPTLLFDCYIREIAKTIMSFVIMIALFIGGSLISHKVTKRTFRGKQQWKRPIVAVLVGMILAVFYWYMVVL